MTLIAPEGVDEELLRLAAEAKSFLSETAEIYRAMSRQSDVSEVGDSPTKIRDRLHEYRKIAISALEDGRRVADEINKAKGIVYDYALDLRAARDEVERLLDRFEAALAAREIPEQSE